MREVMSSEVQVLKGKGVPRLSPEGMDRHDFPSNSRYSIFSS